MNRTFTVVFKDFDSVHLYKDLGSIPYFASTHTNSKSEIITGVSVSGLCPEIYKRLSIICLNERRSYVFYIKVFIYLLSNKKKRILNLYHLHKLNLILVFLCKLFRLCSCAYIKLDFTPGTESLLKKNMAGVKGVFKSLLMRYVDIFTCENRSSYLDLKCLKFFSGRLFYLPNGTSKPKASAEFSYNIKENVVISAGRLDAPVKNIELLVRAFAKAYRKGWVLKLAGQCENEFKIRLKAIFESEVNQKIDINQPCPIIFLGNLRREELFDVYRKSKIFAITSISEGFALVLPEASINGCVIVGTPVGGVADITDSGRLGYISTDHSLQNVSQTLSMAIKNDNLSELALLQQKFCIDNFTWESIVDNLFELIGKYDKVI